LNVWRPLLSGDEANRARSIAIHVADDLVRSFDPVSLAARDAYVTLLFAYLGRVTGNPHYVDFAEQVFDAATRNLQRFDKRSFGLLSGLAGIVWLDAHLDRHFVSAEDAELEGSGDGDVGASDVLAEYLDRPARDRPYELTAGLAGLGIAWLERASDPRTATYLARLVEIADETAIATPEGVTWPTLAEWMPSWQAADYPDGSYNLGVAQGIPGLLVVLARVGASGIARATCERLVRSGFGWVLAQRGRDDEPWVFPSQTTSAGKTGFPALRWCYSGLGIGGAMLASAQLLDVPALENEALRILRSAAIKREAKREGKVVDAGLCHGFAGNGHIFHRAFRLTRDPILEEAARFWIELAIDQHVPGEGIGGYRYWGVAPDAKYENKNPPYQGSWIDDPRWLTGSSGTALALLAAIDDRPAAWDALLGLSG
jgi:lantibiotic biosynthesis protein